MTARGVDFLEAWMGEHVTGEPSDAGLLAAKLVADAAVAGFTLADMELEDATVEDHIREAIKHLGEPGPLGD